MVCVNYVDALLLTFNFITYRASLRATKKNQCLIRKLTQAVNEKTFQLHQPKRLKTQLTGQVSFDAVR